jgi:hypothetical protein
MWSLSVLHVWFNTFGLNLPVCSICQYFMSGSKLLDWITLYVQFVSTSCLVQNFWIESPCMFNLSVLHVWFKTFILNHPVCSTCQYLMSGTKLLDVITLYVQLVSMSCLVQNLDGITLYVQLVQFKTFGWNLLVCSICQYFMSGSNFCIESSCMFNLSVFNVWYKTFGWNHSVCSTCLFFMSDSKLLDWIFLNVQFVSTSCLVQNFWMESPCMFNLSVLHVWFKTFGWNHPLCSTCQYFMSGSKLLEWITL